MPGERDITDRVAALISLAMPGVAEGASVVLWSIVENDEGVARN